MVTTTTSRVQYTANGVTTVFAYPFRILAAEDIQVTTTTTRRG